MNTLMTVGAQSASERMSSRQVSELTGREHKNVMRDIRNLLEQGVNGLNFELVNYCDAKGEQRPEYQLTKKGCMILASGYDAVLREKIIDRWEELELANKPTIPQTYLEALKALVASEETRLMLQEENKLQQQIIHEYEPKVSYYDSILQSTDAMNITVIAKDYGISAKKLNDILHELKIQYKQSTTWLLYQDHSIYGYTKTTTTKYNKPNGEVGTNVHTKWTQKGRLFLYEQLKAYGLIPVIERVN